MVMHSEMTRDTGSTATETGRLRYCMREERTGPRRGRGVGVDGMGAGVPGPPTADAAGVAAATVGSMAAARCASWLIVQQKCPNRDL
jgi:hypothetical protein